MKNGYETQLGGITIIDQSEDSGVKIEKIKEEVQNEFADENNGKKRNRKKQASPVGKHEQKDDPSKRLDGIIIKINDARLELQDAALSGKVRNKIEKKIINLEKQKAALEKEGVTIDDKKIEDETVNKEVTPASWFEERSKMNAEAIKNRKEAVIEPSAVSENKEVVVVAPETIMEASATVDNPEIVPKKMEVIEEDATKNTVTAEIKKGQEDQIIQPEINSEAVHINEDEFNQLDKKKADIKVYIAILESKLDESRKRSITNDPDLTGYREADIRTTINEKIADHIKRLSEIDAEIDSVKNGTGKKTVGSTAVREKNDVPGKAAVSVRKEIVETLKPPVEIKTDNQSENNLTTGAVMGPEAGPKKTETPNKYATWWETRHLGDSDTIAHESRAKKREDLVREYAALKSEQAELNANTSLSSDDQKAALEKNQNRMNEIDFYLDHNFKPEIKKELKPISSSEILKQVEEKNRLKERINKLKDLPEEAKEILRENMIESEVSRIETDSMLENREQIIKDKEGMIEIQNKEIAELKGLAERTNNAEHKVSEMETSIDAAVQNFSKKLEGKEAKGWDKVTKFFKNPRVKTVLACALVGGAYAGGAAALGATGGAAAPVYFMLQGALAKAGIANISWAYAGGSSAVYGGAALGGGLHYISEKIGLIKNDDDAKNAMKEFVEDWQKIKNPENGQKKEQEKPIEIFNHEEYKTAKGLLEHSKGGNWLAAAKILRENILDENALSLVPAVKDLKGFRSTAISDKKAKVGLHDKDYQYSFEIEFNDENHSFTVTNYQKKELESVWSAFKKKYFGGAKKENEVAKKPEEVQETEKPAEKIEPTEPTNNVLDLSHAEPIQTVEPVEPKNEASSEKVNKFQDQSMKKFDTLYQSVLDDKADSRAIYDFFNKIDTLAEKPDGGAEVVAPIREHINAKDNKEIIAKMEAIARELANEMRHAKIARAELADLIAKNKENINTYIFETINEIIDNNIAKHDYEAAVPISLLVKDMIKHKDEYAFLKKNSAAGDRDDKYKTEVIKDFKVHAVRMGLANALGTNSEEKAKYQAAIYSLLDSEEFKRKI